MNSTDVRDSDSVNASVSGDGGVLRAFANTVVPEIGAADPTAWREVERTIARAVALRPAKVRRQLTLFLRVVDWLPVLRYGRRFARLDARRRAAFIDRLERAPVLLVRRGVWGLRTLVLMGWYTREDTMRAIGYAASADGWHARAADGHSGRGGLPAAQ